MFFRTAILILSSLFSIGLYAQKYKSIKVDIDSTFFGVTNDLGLTVSLIKNNGKEIQLKNGDIYVNWNKIKVFSNFYGSFDEGNLKYKASAINAKDHTLSLTISDRRETIFKKLTIELPYVKNIQVYPDTLIVNQYGELDYHLVFSNGKISQRRSSLFDPDDMIVESDFPITLENGKLLVSSDGFLPYEKLPVKFKHRFSGAILAEVQIPIKYPKTVALNFSGNKGADGFSGHNGAQYSESGTDGQAGQNGQSAPLVRVFVEQTLFNNRSFLTITSFSSDHRKTSEIIEFNVSTLTIEAKGGDGGDGGNGGSGRSGLVDREKKIDSPYGGAAGHGGNGGMGGNGGQVVIFMDSSLTWLNKYIVINTEGGKPGMPGKEGSPGNGNYENSYLLGMLLSTKRGASGTPGQSANPGYNGNAGQIILLGREELSAEFKNSAKGNY